MKEGQENGPEVRQEADRIDVTDLLLSSASDMEFAERIAKYSDSDRLLLNIRLADVPPASIKAFLRNRSTALVRIHCTLDEFNSYGNSPDYPKGANIEWVWS